MKNVKNLQWTEKYRPEELDDLILPDGFKNLFKKILNGDTTSPTLIFYGKPGTGKTSAAKLLVKKLNAEYHFQNASKAGENGIQSVNAISDFMSYRPMMGKHPIKYVILDEFDYMTPQAHASLRGVMESFPNHVKFILTCNYINKIPPALKSRGSATLEFGKWDSQEEALKKFTKRNLHILKMEGIEVKNVKYSLEYFKKFLPDFRRSLSKLQMHAMMDGEIDFKKLIESTEYKINESINEIVDLFNSPKVAFNIFRQWIENNKDLFSMADSLEPFYDSLFERIDDCYSTDEFKAEAILILYKYVVEEKSVLNKILSVTSCLTELAILRMNERNR